MTNAEKYIYFKRNLSSSAVRLYFLHLVTSYSLKVLFKVLNQVCGYARPIGFVGEVHVTVLGLLLVLQLTGNVPGSSTSR